jgi:hypothetical protein
MGQSMMATHCRECEHWFHSACKTQKGAAWDQAVMKKHRLPQGDFPNIARFAEGLFESASVPANIVNIAGDDAVSDVEYIDYISEVSGVPVSYLRGDYYRDNYLTDNSKREALVGERYAAETVIRYQSGTARNSDRRGGFFCRRVLGQSRNGNGHRAHRDAHCCKL